MVLSPRMLGFADSLVGAAILHLLRAAGVSAGRDGIRIQTLGWHQCARGSSSSILTVSASSMKANSLTLPLVMLHSVRLL